MNHTTASCGHPVAAVGAPGSLARRACEARPCDRPRCRSGLSAGFADDECEAYCVLRDAGLSFSVDLATRGVVVVARGTDRRYPSLVDARRAWRRGEW